VIKSYILTPSPFIARGFCLAIIENELNLMPYFTRLIKMDRVGVEPTKLELTAYSSSSPNLLFFYYSIKVKFLNNLGQT
jgi:hypothetical protein